MPRPSASAARAVHRAAVGSPTVPRRCRHVRAAERVRGERARGARGARQRAARCVTTRVGYAPEIVVDGDNGYLVDRDARRWVSGWRSSPTRGGRPAGFRPRSVSVESVLVASIAQRYLELAAELVAERRAPHARLAHPATPRAGVLTRIVQIVPASGPPAGSLVSRATSSASSAAAGATVERFTRSRRAGARPLATADRDRPPRGRAQRHLVRTSARRRRAASSPSAPTRSRICHNDVMAGDVYVNHGLVHAAMRARGNYVWRMVRNPVHLFTACAIASATAVAPSRDGRAHDGGGRRSSSRPTARVRAPIDRDPERRRYRPVPSTRRRPSAARAGVARHRRRPHGRCLRRTRVRPQGAAARHRRRSAARARVHAAGRRRHPTMIRAGRRASAVSTVSPTASCSSGHARRSRARTSRHPTLFVLPSAYEAKRSSCSRRSRAASLWSRRGSGSPPTSSSTGRTAMLVERDGRSRR